MKTNSLFVFAVLTAHTVYAVNASAQERVACTAVTRANLVACALRSNLALESERWAEAAAQGRLDAASPILPSNPVLSLGGKRRSSEASDQTALNWSASLSQEIDFSGQRGAQRDAASEGVTAQRWRTTALTRDIAATVWTAYFEILSAHEEVQVAQRLEALSVALQRTTSGRAAQGIGSPIDADLADLVVVRAMQARSGAERQLKVAELTLASLLGQTPQTPPIHVSGELLPLDGVLEFARNAARANAAERPELKALDAERRAQLARAKAFSRSRIPNVTLSVIAEQDGFDEQVFGLAVALPLPLPHPLGRTHAGEIAEAEALASRASNEAKVIDRNLRGGLALALADYESRQRELATFTPERIARAVQTLKNLATEIEQGRVTVRDSLITQQALINLIQAQIETRRSLCLASVELARAAGFPFEGGVK